MTELFWYPGTCARVPLVALEEIGAPFATRPIRPWDREGMAAYRREVNPKGKVPALRFEGRLLTENPAIATFLARRHPEASLLPADDDGQLEALTLMSWFAAGVHPVITRLRFPSMITDHPEAQDVLRRGALATLPDLFALLEARLEGRPWVLGNQWSLVDAYLLWLWFRSVGGGMDPRPFPRLVDHGRRCEARPSVARALDREEKERAELVAQGMPPPLVAVPAAVGRVPLPAGV